MARELLRMVKRLHCPSCGAPVKGGEGKNLTTCEFCDCTLLISGRKITEQKTEQAAEGASAHTPPSALIAEEIGRFELSILEQLTEDSSPDGFAGLALPAERFALIFLRVTDAQAQTIGQDYHSLLERLKASLVEHEDPGLAAYELLEFLSDQLADFRLEVQIVLFEPKTSSVLVYNAGGLRSIYWVSGEEGRVIDVFQSYPVLERKMLKMSRDHFSNSKPVYLSGSDLLVAVSAAYAGRGEGPYSDGTGALVRSLNEHLGEQPLKVVTLAKNAFWNERSPAAKEQPIKGPLRVVAVRVKPSVALREWSPESLRVVAGEQFEIACHAPAVDFLDLVRLHNNRQVFLWFCAADFTPEEYDLGKRAVLELLDRPDYGDNENPRRAGREAAQAIGHGGRFLLVLLLNEYGRTKWYRQGWAQPLGVGPRGLGDPPSAQSFDEGGEATVPEGARQFFPGSLPFYRKPSRAEDLAEAWTGGKASALYQALFGHWRTPDTARALARFLQAAESDCPDAALDGCCLIGRTTA